MPVPSIPQAPQYHNYDKVINMILIWNYDLITSVYSMSNEHIYCANLGLSCLGIVVDKIYNIDCNVYLANAYAYLLTFWILNYVLHSRKLNNMAFLLFTCNDIRELFMALRMMIVLLPTVGYISAISATVSNYKMCSQGMLYQSLIREKVGSTNPTAITYFHRYFCSYNDLSGTRELSSIDWCFSHCSSTTRPDNFVIFFYIPDLVLHAKWCALLIFVWRFLLHYTGHTSTYAMINIIWANQLNWHLNLSYRPKWIHS